MWTSTRAVVLGFVACGMVVAAPPKAEAHGRDYPVFRGCVRVHARHDRRPRGRCSRACDRRRVAVPALPRRSRLLRRPRRLWPGLHLHRDRSLRSAARPRVLRLSVTPIATRASCASTLTGSTVRTIIMAATTAMSPPTTTTSATAMSTPTDTSTTDECTAAVTSTRIEVTANDTSRTNAVIAGAQTATPPTNGAATEITTATRDQTATRTAIATFATTATKLRDAIGESSTTAGDSSEMNERTRAPRLVARDGTREPKRGSSVVPKPDKPRGRARTPAPGNGWLGSARESRRAEAQAALALLASRPKNGSAVRPRALRASPKSKAAFGVPWV